MDVSWKLKAYVRSPSLELGTKCLSLHIGWNRHEGIALICRLTRRVME